MQRTGLSQNPDLLSQKLLFFPLHGFPPRQEPNGPDPLVAPGRVARTIPRHRHPQHPQPKTDAEVNYNYCQYDSDIATGFGVGAFLFLMASQVLIMFASKCFCCGKPLRPGGSRACAVILFITCWVFFFIAEICLLAGSVRNAYHTRYRNIFDEPLDCKSLRKGVFGAGAAFTLFTAIVSEVYYVCYSKARDSFQSSGGDAGVGMGPYK